MKETTVIDDVWNTITGIFDPLHIVLPKRASAKKNAYLKAVRAYNDDFAKLYQKKGKEWIESQKPPIRLILIAKRGGVGRGFPGAGGRGVNSTQP